MSSASWLGLDSSSRSEEEDNFSHVSHLDANSSILSEADLDNAKRAIDDSTGELRNMVPTGVIGAEHRERQREHDEVKQQRVDEGGGKPRNFTNLRKLNARESEQALNVMCVGEAGLGKSTFVDSFFKTHRQQDGAEALAAEDSARVQQKRQALTRKENVLREAEKEKKRLTDNDDLRAAQQKQEEIQEMREEAMALRAEMQQMRDEDKANRTQMQEMKQKLKALKRDKEQAKCDDNLQRAQEVKEQIEAVEEKMRAFSEELRSREHRTEEQAAGGRWSSTSSAGASPGEAAGAGSPAGGLIGMPTVQVTQQPAFYIKHRMGDQPPVNLKVTMIDTPGYGETTDLEATFKKIVGYVDEQFERVKADAELARPTIEEANQPLVHCVLYFIAPHRLKPVDVAFMRELHKKVNVVPIIAKADTMTSDEKKEFRTFVREELEKKGVDVFEFHQATVDEMSRQAQVTYEHPWSVIATKDARVEDGVLIAKRVYDYGDADAADPRHSDLPALQELILGEPSQWHDLKVQTRSKYDAWRAEVKDAEDVERATPQWRKVHAKALKAYSAVPQTVSLAVIALLASVIIAPGAATWASSLLSAREEEHCWGRLDQMKDDLARLKADQRELQSARDEGAKAWQRVKELTRQVRKWHASSRAWFLEPLPREFVGK